MPYIDNTKYKEILSAGRNGNEKAKLVMQAMMKGGSQDDINRLVDEYYGLAVEPEEPAEMPPVVEMNSVTEPQNDIPEEMQPENVDTLPGEVSEPVDLSELLGGETEGLFDEEDFCPKSFCDYLKDKKKSSNKALKNADYFKAFDMDGRHAFEDKAISDYTGKFSNDLDDILRKHGDMDKSISIYIQKANDTLDDDMPFSQESAGKAYDGIVDNDRAMRSFGRHWDDTDMEIVVDELKELMAQYGKKNVIAALNLLKSDNDAHRDFQNNAIDQNISKYAKSVKSLLD